MLLKKIQAPIKLVEYTNSAVDGIHAISLTHVVVSKDDDKMSAHCPSAKANGHSNVHAMRYADQLIFSM